MMRSMFILVYLLLAGATWSQPIGERVQDFQFLTPEGSEISLRQLGKQSESGVVVLTFWCTKCASCRAAEKPLRDLSKEYRGKATIVAVSSSRYDSPATVKSYLNRTSLDLPVVLDKGSALGRHFQVYRTTTTLVLDGDQRLRYFGTLKKRQKFYARESLKAVLNSGVVGQPLGPILG